MFAMVKLKQITINVNDDSTAIVPCIAMNVTVYGEYNVLCMLGRFLCAHYLTWLYVIGNNGMHIEVQWN